MHGAAPRAAAAGGRAQPHPAACAGFGLLDEFESCGVGQPRTPHVDDEFESYGIEAEFAFCGKEPAAPRPLSRDGGADL